MTALIISVMKTLDLCQIHWFRCRVRHKDKKQTGAQGGHYLSSDGAVSYGSNAPKWTACQTGVNELEAAEWSGITGKEGWAKEVRWQGEAENSNDKQSSQRGQFLNFDCDHKWKKSVSSDRKRAMWRLTLSKYKGRENPEIKTEKGGIRGVTDIFGEGGNAEGNQTGMHKKKNQA